MTDPLDCLVNERVKITRFGKAVLIGGQHKASKQKPFYIAASVQNLSGLEKETLPEGRRQSYVLKLYTKERLVESDDQAAQRADIVQVESEEFEVFQVEKHRGLGLDHYKTLVARLNKR